MIGFFPALIFFPYGPNIIFGLLGIMAFLEFAGIITILIMMDKWMKTDIEYNLWYWQRIKDKAIEKRFEADKQLFEFKVKQAKLKNELNKTKK